MKRHAQKNVHLTDALVAMLESSPSGILLKDGIENIVFCNRRFFDVWGFDFTEPNDINGKLLIEEAVKRVSNPGEFINILYKYMEPENFMVKGVDTINLIDGRAIERYTTPVFDKNGIHYGRAFYFDDVTDKFRAEEEIRSLTYHDSLTKLANRRLLFERLLSAMTSGRRNNHYSAILLIDLDRFKPVNDRFGHDVGDALLIEVGRRLTRCVREADTVARLGGDEFVIVLPILGNTRDLALSDGRRVAEKICDAFATPFLIKSAGGTGSAVVYSGSASIGLSVFQGDQQDHGAVLRMADRAMHLAKADGGNTIRTLTE
jgi:diguanylate cyclase (GGDEF)-like protein